ncbi:MAG: ribosome small subunit-dependent GTPase A [Bryobacteraceae bacterium]|nr:ribosome small subunit-dependent GTPase A [Bryobacteraceae bacterium]
MSFADEALALPGPGQQLARVCASYGERARVILEGAELDAMVAGALLYAAADADGRPGSGKTSFEADLPVTGDWVAARRVDADLALIERVLPRRSKIARRAAGRRDREQTLAANIDLAFIVCGLDGDFNIRRLERYLAIAREGGVEPVIALNKADVCAAPEEAADDVRRVTRAQALVISARTGEGCEAIEALLGPGVTAALLGSSGAGKSTLLNRIVGASVHKTAPVRQSDSRGRHATTWRELVELPSGAALIDTPGLREIQLWATEESVAAVFEDIAELAAHCRFRDCSHTSEPGCAVRGTVEAGRLESFNKLQREAERISGARTEKQRWRSAHKAARQLYKLRGR